MNVIQVFEHISRDRNLPFLVIGGHAVVASGYRRTTDDLDIIVVTKEQSPVDLTDIVEIVAANKIDVAGDKFKEICEHYRTAELYARIVENVRKAEY